MVDLFFIKTFIAVAKTGSFRIAAERNFVTQPAISQHIKILEQKLNSALFERQGKRIFLAPAGKIFLPYAENMLKQYAEAKIRIEEITNQLSGTIRIATIYSIGLHDLQPLVARFLRKYPKINIHLEYGHNNTIYESVLNRTIDFGLVAFPRKVPGIHSTIFSEDKLVLTQSPHYRVFPKRPIFLKELHQKKFITFSSNSPTGEAINHFLRRKGIAPQIIHEYDNIETLKSAIKLGMGCSLVPQKTITHELKEGSMEIIPVRGLNFKRPLGILCPNRKILTKSSKAFYEIMVGGFNKI